MKIKQLFFGLILACVCICTTAAAEETGFGIAAFTGYYNTSSSTFIDSDVNFETAPTYGGAITYHFTPKISVELATTKYSSQVELAFDDKSARFGEIEQTPILYTVRFQFPIRKSNSHIYLGLGAGYIKNEFSHLNESELNEFFGVNIRDAKIHDSVSWHGNVGVEMRLRKHFALYLDLKAIFNQPKFDVVFEDYSTAEKDVGMNVSLFVCGAKYYF